MSKHLPRWTGIRTYAVLAALAATFGGQAHASPLPQSLTYQGQLVDNGAFADGPYDMQFRLFDAPEDGTPIGSPVVLPGVEVVDGLFTVELNAGGEFGLAAFNGAARWLEITVNDTVLSPRQPITAAPYSVFALKPWQTNGASVYYNGGNVGIGTTTPFVPLEVADVDANGAIWATSNLGADPQGAITAETTSNDGNAIVAYADNGPGAWAVVGQSATGIAIVGSSPGGVAGYFDGNVGIGTLAPAQKLDVRGHLQVQNSILLDPSNAPMIVRQWSPFESGPLTGIGRWGMYMQPHTLFFGVPGTDYGDTSRLTFGGWLLDGTRQDWMSITEGGNVGIGTIAPGSSLHVVDNDAETGSSLRLDSQSNQWSLVATGSEDPEGPYNLLIRDSYYGLTRVQIDDAGNVGIGTSDPLARLGVHNGGGAAVSFKCEHDGSNFIVRPVSAGGTSTIIENTGNAGHLVINPNGGNVGIGATNPKSSLHVNGDYYGKGHVWLHAFEGDGSNGTAYVQARDTSGTSSLSLQFRTQAGGTIVNALRINSDGKVGIGTADPAGFLLAVNGAAAKPGGGMWSSYSDARLKRDITPMTGTLDRLLSLHGYEFAYTSEAIEQRMGLAGRQLGLIAQEVEQVFPDWVARDDQGYLHVTERATTALMVEALRDLREEKDRQLAQRDRRIADLETRLRALEARLEASLSSVHRNP